MYNDCLVLYTTQEASKTCAEAAARLRQAEARNKDGAGV